MSQKKSKKHKSKDYTSERRTKYTGPFQTNQFARIDALKHVMDITGHSPTKETFSPLSESDMSFPNEDELSNQLLEERRSPTETKKKILKVGLYFLWIVAGAAILTAIRFFYDHDLRISKTENEVEILSKDVDQNSDDINDLKTDKKLFEYQLNELKNEKK